MPINASAFPVIGGRTASRRVKAGGGVSTAVAIFSRTICSIWLSIWAKLNNIQPEGVENLPVCDARLRVSFVRTVAFSDHDQIFLHASNSEGLTR